MIQELFGQTLRDFRGFGRRPDGPTSPVGFVPASEVKRLHELAANAEYIAEL
jgi:hypothetical protein